MHLGRTNILLNVGLRDCFSLVDSLVPRHKVLSVSCCGSEVHNVYCNINDGDTLLSRVPEQSSLDNSIGQKSNQAASPTL